MGENRLSSRGFGLARVSIVNVEISWEREISCPSAYSLREGIIDGPCDCCVDSHFRKINSRFVQTPRQDLMQAFRLLLQRYELYFELSNIFFAKHID